MRLASAGDGAGRGDRDRQRTGADDRREDEVAERRHVDDVHEHRAALGVLEDADVHVGVAGRGDHHEGALEVGRAGYSRRSQPIEPSRGQLAASGSIASGAISVTSPSQASRPSTFSSPTSPPPMTRQRRPLSSQAGDVERRLEHPLHAALVADPPAELADAFLAGVGLGGHEPESLGAGLGPDRQLLGHRGHGPLGRLAVREQQVGPGRGHVAVRRRGDRHPVPGPPEHRRTTLRWSSSTRWVSVGLRTSTRLSILLAGRSSTTSMVAPWATAAGAETIWGSPRNR